MVYKECNKCGQSKPVAENYFYKNGTNRDGFMNTCKRCHSTAMRERYSRTDPGLCPTCKQPKPSNES